MIRFADATVICALVRGPGRAPCGSGSLGGVRVHSPCLGCLRVAGCGGQEERQAELSSLGRTPGLGSMASGFPPLPWMDLVWPACPPIMGVSELGQLPETHLVGREVVGGACGPGPQPPASIGRLAVVGGSHRDSRAGGAQGLLCPLGSQGSGLPAVAACICVLGTVGGSSQAALSTSWAASLGESQPWASGRIACDLELTGLPCRALGSALSSPTPLQSARSRPASFDP